MRGYACSSSKAGLLGLTRHLAFDYGPKGNRANDLPNGVALDVNGGLFMA